MIRDRFRGSLAGRPRALLGPVQAPRQYHNIALVGFMGVGKSTVGQILASMLDFEFIDTDRVTRVDFGTGDDRYKADWMSTRNELVCLDCYHPATFVGLFGIMRQLAARSLGR